MAHSRSFLANQKARNAIVGAENLLILDISDTRVTRACSPASIELFTIHGPVQEQGALLATRIEGFSREVDAQDLAK